MIFNFGIVNDCDENSARINNIDLKLDELTSRYREGIETRLHCVPPGEIILYDIRGHFGVVRKYTKKGVKYYFLGMDEKDGVFDEFKKYLIGIGAVKEKNIEDNLK